MIGRDLRQTRISEDTDYEIARLMAPYKTLPPMFRGKNFFDIAQHDLEKRQIEDKWRNVRDDSFSSGYDQGVQHGRGEGWNASAGPHRQLGYNKGFVDASRMLIEGDNHMIVEKGNPKNIVRGHRLDNLIANIPRNEGIPLEPYKYFQPDNDELYGYKYGNLYDKNSSWIDSGDMMYLNIKNMRRVAQEKQGIIKGKHIPVVRPRSGTLDSTPADLDIILNSLLPGITDTTLGNYRFQEKPRMKQAALLEYKKGK